ncbi:MAG: hypothetical protein V3R83_09680 [Gammaproteobacteria bacterium]
MTIRSWLVNRGVENGLWENEAQAVVNQIADDETLKALGDVLEKSADGYPKQFFAVAWMTFESEAIKWIDANKPKHFARPMFDPNHEVSKATA